MSSVPSIEEIKALVATNSREIEKLRLLQIEDRKRLILELDLLAYANDEVNTVFDVEIKTVRDTGTKVLGYLRCARAVAPVLKERGWGRIINISGLAARQSGTAIGSMRNVAVAALTKNLADELGPHGINVTVVHPGLTWTERMPALM